jgi:hypothetical protein
VNLQTEQLNALKTQFVAMDTNHTGTITQEEFMKALSSSSIPAEEVESLFVTVDQDQTGQIKYSEFIAACMDEKVRPYPHFFLVHSECVCSLSLSPPPHLSYAHCPSLLSPSQLVAVWVVCSCSLTSTP